jgi:hypothetical protein
MIRDNYTDLPNVLSETLPRILADPDTRTGLQELREEGWLDWQILLALANIAANLRLQQASPGSIPRDYPTRFFQTPESHYATTLPLNVFTADSLRAQMDVTLLAVAQRRWKLGSAMTTPNPQAFKELLTTRYNYAADDVPHRDLLNGAPDERRTLIPPGT